MNDSKEKALQLLLEYNKQTFHIQHAITVDEILDWYAQRYDYDPVYWGTVGLLHDLDYELYPNEHCIKNVEILSGNGYSQSFINSICSHGYGICTKVRPEHFMEKILYSVDELSGIISAMVLVRPSHSTKDITLMSLKKKFKDKAFAAKCSRAVIKGGADMLEWQLDYLLEQTLIAIQEKEDIIKCRMQNINKQV